MEHATFTKYGGEPNPLDNTGLCLLSLDGGGVRGLSTLYMLKSIMDRLNYERKDSNRPPVRPCEIFDLIGGTGTGGLIAILLGRLEMDADQCIAAYSDLAAEVFGEKRSTFPVTIKRNVKAQFDSAKLESSIRKVVEQTGSAGTDLLNDGTEHSCRTFVCTADHHTKGIVRLRSYTLPDEPDIPATICQAALATSATTTFFDPAAIGNRSFADGGLANNPVNEVEEEASNIWCSETADLKPLVKCFISIGPGTPNMNAFEKNMLKTLLDIATETERTQSDFISRWAKQSDENRYFRFNIDQGLQSIGLDEYEKQGQMEAATELYLTHAAQKFRVRGCIQNLSLKQGAAATNLFYLISDYNLRKAQHFSVAGYATTSNAFGYDRSGYHIDSVLDRGAFGVVTQVHHRASPKTAYARKQLPLTKVKVEKVQEEVELIRQASHRHVVEVIDEYQDRGWYYIVMKPLADRNLESFLRECMGIRTTNSTSWNQFGEMRRNLFQWMGCLAVTIKYLHDNNIRHRDIKPQNILVHGGNILLTDFGTSFTFDGSTVLTYTSTRGTEIYQPPEANDNTRYGRRGDIFSLGCVFFEMAEAASRPVLKAPLPQVTGTYASCASVAEFRDRLSSGGEEHLLLMKRIPERFRFNNLLPALLSIVAQMIDPDPDKRCDAGSLVLRTAEAFSVHGFVSTGCCELVTVSPPHT